MRPFVLLLACLLLAPLAVAEDEGTRACVAAACAYDATYTYGDATCEERGLRHASTGAGVAAAVVSPGAPSVVVVGAVYATDYCTNNGSSRTTEHGLGATASAPAGLVMAWWGESDGSSRFPDGCHVGAVVAAPVVGWTPIFVPCLAGAPPDLGWGGLLP